MQARFFLVLIWMLPALCHAQGDPQYVLPLKIDYKVSGSYAELRGNHYHAGLDMATYGVENLPVYAAEDGWVSRVKVGAYGYGRALYIDHADGHTTVYGHLNGFSAKIDSAIRAEQYRTESFEAQIFLKKDVIPVKRDEVVAFSGNTGGSGGPHVHFEVRDTQSEQPLNPLRFVRGPVDTTPPLLYGVKAYALSDSSQVAGSSADKYYSLQSISGKTITAYGRIGFGVHCTDYIVAGGRPCGVIEIDLYDNDKLVFRSRVDTFSFDLNRHVNSHIDYAERLTSKRFIQKSFVAPGNQLKIYSEVSTPTYVGEGERHDFRYEVKDFAGNVSKVGFTVVGKRNASVRVRRKPEGSLVDWRRTFAKDTLGMEVVIPRESLYEDTYIAFRSGRLGTGRQVFTVGDAGIPTQKAFTLTVPVPAKWQQRGKQVFLGTWNGKGVGYVGGTMADGHITAQSLSFGSFSVDIDTIAPSVVSKNKTNRLKSSHYVFIGISDNMSGIAQYSVRIDGKWEVFEYDYKNARLKANVGYLGLKPGNHTLHAEVSDACGNKTTFDWSFAVVN